MAHKHPALSLALFLSPSLFHSPPPSLSVSDTEKLTPPLYSAFMPPWHTNTQLSLFLPCLALFLLYFFKSLFLGQTIRAMIEKAPLCPFANKKPLAPSQFVLFICGVFEKQYFVTRNGPQRGFVHKIIESCFFCLTVSHPNALSHCQSPAGAG